MSEYSAWSHASHLVAPACCDCSLATAGPSIGNFPRGCFDCFTVGMPDPSGRCSPPGGFTSTTTSWCCSVTDTPHVAGTAVCTDCAHPVAGCHGPPDACVLSLGRYPVFCCSAAVSGDAGTHD